MRKARLICLNTHTHTTKLTALSSRHSQSALEYMMTYGWAILIIVIVAAALWSFGVFSPFSSRSQSLTGFAGLGSVQAACYNNGTLLISIGDSTGLAINVTAINATSSLFSSQKVIRPNKTISPSGLAIFGINNACPTAAGASFLLNLVITYKEIGAQLPGLQFSFGMVSGTVAAPPFIHYLLINVTNSQSTASASPFQQMVNISLSGLTGYINNAGAQSFQNVEFVNSTNGSVIPSWLENYSFSKNWALYWIRLPNGIAANTKITGIKLSFASNKTNFFNNQNIGESPKLSAAYGQYDDGAKVFKFYSNFSGTTLNPNWNTNFYVNGSAKVNNGLNFAPSTHYGLAYSAGFIPPAIFDAYIINFTSNTFPAAIGETNGSGFTPGTGSGYFMSNNGGPACLYGSFQTGFFCSNAGTNVFSPGIAGYSWTASNGQTTYSNYKSSALSNSNLAFSSSVYPEIGNLGGNAIAFSIQWVRVRAYPPNGVMPSVSFGSVQ